MINETLVTKEHCCTTHCHCHCFKRISWSALFVGALIGVGLSFLLNLFGVAIGLSAITVGPTGSVTVAVGGLIGIFIAVIVSMLTAGYAAGYLGHPYCPNKCNLGILYGFTTWSVALVLAAAVVAPVSHFAVSYFHAIGGSTLMMSQQTTPSNNPAKITVKTTPSAVAANQVVTQVNSSTTSLACGAFILFALFFVGAISTCLGACWAMACQKEE